MNDQLPHKLYRTAVAQTLFRWAPPPGVDPDGGPNGAGDAYLAVSSAGGGGAGSKMVVFNTDPHWLGNYSLAGVSRITFDIQNRSFTTLPRAVCSASKNATRSVRPISFAIIAR